MLGFWSRCWSWLFCKWLLAANYLFNDFDNWLEERCWTSKWVIEFILCKTMLILGLILQLVFFGVVVMLMVLLVMLVAVVLVLL